MTDKPEFVDLISEATAQSYRRSMPRIVDLPTAPKETSRLSHWPPEHWAAVADGSADAVEDQAVARQGLGLSGEHSLPLKKTGAPPGACFVSACLTNNGYP